MISLIFALLAGPIPAASAVTPAVAPLSAPRIADTRLYRIRQTVALRDVPASAKEVRLWVPIPTDGSWQRVLDRRVVEAPPGWKFERQPHSEAEMIVATTKATGTVQVVVETTVQRQSPVFDLTAPAAGEIQPALFTDDLRQDAPLMAVDPKVMEIARTACGGETDPARKVVRLLDAVADAADHYLKDPTKPKCGRGAAEDCLTNGGGCCTDLHSLFIALARSQGIPTRIQFGYRLNAAKEDTEYDPSYRCWVEYYLPGAGWVPTDIVVADAGERDTRAKNYGTLDARRVWLWEGRALELIPRQAGAPIQTMLCGWAEIDGTPVDVLPAADGTPSKISRTIRFQDLTPKEPTAAK
jgi:transglutaminase-like putative cysteine protease